MVQVAQQLSVQIQVRYIHQNLSFLDIAFPVGQSPLQEIKTCGTLEKPQLSV